LVASRWSSIDATLTGLGAIDAWGQAHGDLRGVFAAAYHVVTAAVADAAQRGSFHDPEWVEQVVVDFADRYRSAMLAATRGQSARGWGPAMQRSRGGGLAAIVALLQAMIAHIHYDLPHSLSVCAPIDARRLADYDRLGALICGSTREIQRVIVSGYARELRELHCLLGGADTWLTNIVVVAWRSRALTVARQLHGSPTRAGAWSRRLELESALLARVLDTVAWPVRGRPLAPSHW
jgi:hypothetical protein